MTTVPKLSLRDALLGVCVALTWGMGMVFAKAAITHFPPILLMAMRFSITALALVWFVRPPIAHLKMLALIAFISAAVQYSLTYTGLKNLDASAAALIVQLEVPFLTLFGVIALKEKTSWLKWLGIGLAFFGVWQISGAPKIAAAWGSVLMVVGGAAVWAVGQVMIRALRDIDGLTVTAWIAVMAAPQLLIMSLIFETDHIAAVTSATWVVWGAAFYMGLIMTALGYGIWYTLVRRNPVGQVAPFLLLLPLFSVAGAVIFLGESLSLHVMIGGAIVIAGVAVIMFDKNS
ncbi:DMT family transporter [Roseovarius sp. EL26]|uniref:DMT family transporter n=1 Tax=Roseovarius sp. EL26 TaxID=2126672 RepID=UPI000EA1123B|nr:EamA family transporter [Roseovarius sp. EL26]